MANRLRLRGIILSTSCCCYCCCCLPACCCAARRRNLFDRTVARADARISIRKIFARRRASPPYPLMTALDPNVISTSHERTLCARSPARSQIFTRLYIIRLGIPIIDRANKKPLSHSIYLSIETTFGRFVKKILRRQLRNPPLAYNARRIRSFSFPVAHDLFRRCRLISPGTHSSRLFAIVNRGRDVHYINKGEGK